MAHVSWDFIKSDLAALPKFEELHRNLGWL